MGMLFGGWAREEEGKSEEEKGYDRGFSEGRKSGYNDGISKAQIIVMQSAGIDHKEVMRIYGLLENSKWK